MQETKTIPITLPDSVWTEAMALAEKRNLSLDAVVLNAIVKYERDLKWEEIFAYGKERGRASGYREEDVVRLCREVRKELGDQRRLAESAGGLRTESAGG